VVPCRELFFNYSTFCIVLLSHVRRVEITIVLVEEVGGLTPKFVLSFEGGISLIIFRDPNSQLFTQYSYLSFRLAPNSFYVLKANTAQKLTAFEVFEVSFIFFIYYYYFLLQFSLTFFDFFDFFSIFSKFFSILLYYLYIYLFSAVLVPCHLL
jgi:hypothetical protein